MIPGIVLGLETGMGDGNGRWEWEMEMGLNMLRGLRILGYWGKLAKIMMYQITSFKIETLNAKCFSELANYVFISRSFI